MTYARTVYFFPGVRACPCCPCAHQPPCVLCAVLCVARRRTSRHWAPTEPPCGWRLSRAGLRSSSTCGLLWRRSCSPTDNSTNLRRHTRRPTLHYRSYRTDDWFKSSKRTYSSNPHTLHLSSSFVHLFWITHDFNYASPVGSAHISLHLPCCNLESFFFLHPHAPHSM